MANPITHQILPGSLEFDGVTLTAGVHTGSSVWEIKGLRYVQAPKAQMTETDTIETFLTRVYDRSTGNLLRHDFKDPG